MSETPHQPGTKRARKLRTTRASVRVAERLARALITLGGGLTIVAVSAICIFLVWVVVPMFEGVEFSSDGAARLELDQSRRPLHAGLDEYRELSWTVFEDGTLELYALADGRRIDRRTLFDGAAPTCSSYNTEDGSLAFGFADGSVRLGSISFGAQFLAEESAAEHLKSIAVGARKIDGDGLVERTREGQLRRSSLTIVMDEPLDVGAPVELVDKTMLSAGPALCTLSSDGKLTLSLVRKSVNLLTDEVTTRLSRSELPHRELSADKPIAVKLLGGGDNVLVVWSDGRCVRYDVRDYDAPVEAEVIDLVPEEGARVTALDFVIGKRTLIVGDSLGRVRGWFRIKPDDAGTSDGARFVVGHQFDSDAGAVTALAPSAASRAFAVGHQSGEARLYFMTSEKLLGRARTSDGAPLTALALAPREDAVVATTSNSLSRWTLSGEHPEVSVASLFLPVWYENYTGAEHVWQSSSGTDDFEPKFGLMPLIIGTLKATFYSMLFGAPLALLAALFSSEFLEPRLRVGVKSTIEVMASLPSVVLGFLSAIVIAPVVQDLLSETLTSFYTVPFCLLAGAYAWQLVPQRLSVRAQGWPRFALIGAMIPVGLAIASALGPWVERTLFAGDIEGWLAGTRGSAFGGWIFLLVPVCAALVALFSGRVIGPYFRGISMAWSRAQCARSDVLRFVGATTLTIALAVLFAFALDAAGWDPRGALVDTYVQRNALVVGFIMGFAIIPIIYTLAEDALNSVPSHLRLASLGAGATPWQTAVRVIVPTAASGLFSAVMVGLGRAVGETMIVLMAAGNTPVMEWNVFSGFRTLSANIAVELPEAVEGSTHYRTLFLAALTLFVITFAVNTAAEIVRQRFRKRAFQL